jgi:signal transduction histidine kinase
MAGDLHDRLPVSRHPDSFGLLCAHINTMLDRIETLMVEVRGIGDDIAHQIRTPLTRLRARLERQMDGVADHAAFADNTADTLRDIDGVLAIVAALLRIREIEDHARRSRFAPVDLARLVADACDLHGPTVEEAGMVFACRIEAQATVTGDASLLMEAVSNLIDNAVKFGPPGGTVSLVLRREADAPVIAVADQGPGVLATERELVTQRFYRGRHDAAGVGLGLSLVRAITDLHGCRLVFADRGSAVRIECPPAQD